MDDARRHELRTIFEGIAEAYDQARPLYPPELFTDLLELAQLEPGDRILEIGCGTAQATRPLAERGLELTCVELGTRLAAIARAKLAGFPNATIVNGDFEKWQPEQDPFDAVVAFTAFHWLDPKARLERSAQLLRPGGSLAVTETTHVRPEGGDSFWDDVEEDYEAVVPSAENGPPPRPDEVKDLQAEIEASGLFDNVRVRRYTWNVTYGSAEYIALLDTYSGHLSMPREARERLHRLIRRRIDEQPGQRVTKTYLAVLNVAARV